MKNSEITDVLFLEAVEAIDSGNLIVLETLLTKNPRLVRERLDYPSGGYFRDPYLIWFVADNPIRVDKLPHNITEVIRLLIGFVKRESAGNFQEQFDYTLGLVATGRIPRECGVQIEMIDLLIDEGAKPGDGLGALANGNMAAAEHLIKRGAKLTLAAAICLEHGDDINQLAVVADKDEKLVALTVAAFYGKAHMIPLLLNMGADPNDYPKSTSGFHSHATPLHQAVSSGSLESVKVLVEAGAKLDLKDKIYGGTPMGWAEHMKNETSFDEAAKKDMPLSLTISPVKWQIRVRDESQQKIIL